MPSVKPRLALTLNPETRAAVKDLAEATGKAEATVVVELLVELVPQMHALAKMTRHANSGRKAAAKRVLQHMVGDAMAAAVEASQPELFKERKKR